MEKPIQEYLPKKKELYLVQARIPKELAEKVTSFMEKNDLSWSDVVKACFEKLVDENPQKGKK